METKPQNRAARTIVIHYCPQEVSGHFREQKSRRNPENKQTKRRICHNRDKKTHQFFSIFFSERAHKVNRLNFPHFFCKHFFPMQPYVASPSPTSHKLPMALLACVPQIPYRPLWRTLPSRRLQGFKMKPVAAPLTLSVRLKIHCFLALQLE